MKKRLWIALLFAALALSLTGCGNARQEESGGAEPPSTEEDGQNPVMNFVGVYHWEDSTEALVEADGMENAVITVTYAVSPWFHDETVMSGRFDPETCTVAFTNAAMTEYIYRSDGSVGEEKAYFTDVAGKAVFDQEDNTLTITEELSSGPMETVYTWGAAPDMKTVTDPDHYAAVTAMDKAKVETVIAYGVRAAYLGENWHALADLIEYPITINGVTLNDSIAFIDYMQDKTLSPGDRAAMNDEDLLDMFVNGQGICMGSGQIWLNDPNYMTDQEPTLTIIAISGIISEEESEAFAAGLRDGASETAEAEPRREDGERFERVIIMEGMEETAQYEHLRNESAGFEMDYEYETFERRSEPDGESFFLVWDDSADPLNYLEVKRSQEDASAVAAAVSEELSKEYALITESTSLDRAGECLRIGASEVRGHGRTPDLMQMVYIIPTGDGCLVATEHYTAEASEGLGRRFSYMMNTLSLLD